MAATKKAPPAYPTTEQLATLSERELERGWPEVTPVGGWSGPKKSAASRLAKKECWEKQRSKELAAVPVEPPIPTAIASSVNLPDLPSVSKMLADTVTYVAKCGAIDQREAEAAATYEREKAQRVARQVAAVTDGETVPVTANELAAEREFRANRAARDSEREVMAGVAVALRKKAEEALSAEILRLQAGVREQSTQRMRLARAKLHELLALMDDEMAAERCALQQISRVKRALAAFPLGPAVRVTQGSLIEGTWQNGAPVVVGREPDSVEQLDSPARKIIRGFVEDRRTGMPAIATRALWQVLSQDRVKTAIAILEKEGH